MCNNSIDQRVIDLLQSFLQIDLMNAGKDTLLPELDSVVYIELVVMIEIEFDIELYDEELLYNSQKTIRDWIDIVESHLTNTTENGSFDNPLLG